MSWRQMPRDLKNNANFISVALLCFSICNKINCTIRGRVYEEVKPIILCNVMLPCWVLYIDLSVLCLCRGESSSGNSVKRQWNLLLYCFPHYSFCGFHGHTQAVVASGKSWTIMNSECSGKESNSTALPSCLHWKHWRRLRSPLAFLKAP